MNIVNMYGDVTWANVTIEDVIRDELREAEGDHIDRLQANVDTLVNIVSTLVERIAKDDTDAIALVGRSWKWEVDNG